MLPLYTLQGAGLQPRGFLMRTLLVLILCVLILNTWATANRACVQLPPALQTHAFTVCRR